MLASHNLHKLREIREMLKEEKAFDLISLREFPNYTPPEETGTTFEENAAKKALYAAQALKKWCLADDSGIVVPSLGGEPGIHSKRYAGDAASDLDNRNKLLKALKNKEGLDRSAYFVCVLALANPNGEVKTLSATCEGIICDSEKGGQGFGYDSIFAKNGYDKTFAQMDEKTKNRISHRRKAIDKLIHLLYNWVK